MEIDDVRSDLHALKNLYRILQIRGSAQRGLVNESLDEKSRLLLKKLLDGATEQAFQSHSKIMEEQSASSHLPQPEKSQEALRRLHSLDLLKTTISSQNETPVGTSNRAAGRFEYQSQEETPAVPTKKLKAVHAQSRRERRPCPICNNNPNLKPQNSAAEKKSSDTKMAMPMPKEEHAHPNHSCICRHHQQHHLPLRRGLSRTRSGRELAAKETEEKLDISEAASAAIRRIEDRIPVLRQMESVRLTGRMPPTPHRAEAYVEPTRTQQMLSQTKERDPATDEIPGQSRSKNWRQSSSLPLVKDAVHQSTDKMKERRVGKQSRNGRGQKSALTKTAEPSTPKKPPDALKPNGAKEVARVKNREQGDRRAALMNQKPHPSMKREEEAEEKKKVGPTPQSQRSILHRGRSYQKLPPRRRRAVEIPSQTGSSYTTESTASRTSLSSVAPPMSVRKKRLLRGMPTHHARRKYSSSSSSSSPRWLLSRPTPSLARSRAGRERPEKRGRLRRFKDKLAFIFHHHHHHHHHHGGNGDSEEESPIPSRDSHRHRPIWKQFGKFHGERTAEASAAVIRAPRRQEHPHGHLYALLHRLLSHVCHSRTKVEKVGFVGERREMAKKGRVVGVGRNGDKKMGWWQGGGVKLGGRTKPRLALGLQKARRNKTQVSCDAKN